MSYNFIDMVLTETEKQELEYLYQSLYSDEKVRRMYNIPMHRGSNCFIHSFKVAKLAIKRALRHKKVDLKALLYAAIFHDYYLYDWRRDRSKKKKHGRNHPFLAAKQAKDDFDIPKESIDIIHSHMWPLNFKKLPKTKEARILTLADKAIATGEALTSKKHKLKIKGKEEEFIKTLF